MVGCLMAIDNDILYTEYTNMTQRCGVQKVYDTHPISDQPQVGFYKENSTPTT